MGLDKYTYNTFGRYSFDIACITDKGGRVKNEDTLICTHKQENDIVFCAVADGLGAHGGGDIASDMAIKTADTETALLKRLSPKYITALFEKMNDAVVQCQTDEINMKTTFAGVFIKGKKIYLANIGDTRIYRFDDNTMTGVTADHSMSYNEVIGAGGSLDDIRRHPMRHILDAAIGVEVLRKPDIYVNKLTPNQAYLICSDGFWDCVVEQDMEEALTKNENAEQWLENMLEIHRNNAGEWHDNYSAVCIIVNKDTKGHR